MTFDPAWGYGSLVALIVGGCLAAAWYLPPFRKLALTIAGGVVAVFAIYKKGSDDAKERAAKLRAEEERAAVARGNKARSDAVRDVSSGRVRDRFDRDDL